MHCTTIIQIYNILITQLDSVYGETESRALTRMVLEKVLEKPAYNILANQNHTIDTAQLNQINDILQQLLTQKPIQYIFGETLFYGLTIQLNSNVLIPRPETEELVDWILKTTPSNKPLILDIGTGSGVIAIALAKNISSATVSGIDISAEAIEIAKKNAMSNCVNVSFAIHDVFQLTANPFDKPFDIIVSNPPYVCMSEKQLMKPNVLENEPSLALFVPDSNPLVFYEAIASAAKNLLRNEGWVYCEINERFGVETTHLFQLFGFVDVELKKDINSKNRMLRARLK